MKRFRLIIAVTLSLALLFGPSSASLAAGKPVAFESTGAVLGINPGTVSPAGNSGRWNVADRWVLGYIVPVTGNIGGMASMTYDANVNSAQVGTFRGTLLIFQDIDGDLQPDDVTGDGVPDTISALVEGRTGSSSPIQYSVAGSLTIMGGTGAYAGIQGTGRLSGDYALVLDAGGHVVGVEGTLTISGKAQYR
ncbi:MAG: hypothetical protein HYX91_02430 [Chloroflexi bacterium]|nr:hypothetical protein [Chloroflexota bacterium]